jgi:glucan biosynthesis protein C
MLLKKPFENPDTTHLSDGDQRQYVSQVAQKKDASIETLRGLAALLLVAFHAVEPSVSAASNSWADYFAYTFSLIRMPLFTVISGYVYALRPIQAGPWSGIMRFLKGKSRRLLLPLFSSIAIVACLRATMGKTPESTSGIMDWLSFFTHSYQIYWFLQGLMWVFLLIAILEQFRLLKTLRRWLIALIAVTVIGKMMPGTDFFSFWALGYLAPFFLLGIGLHRFEAQLKNPAIVQTIAILALGLLFFQQVNWWVGLEINTSRLSTMSILVGMSSCFTLILMRCSIQPLAILGKHSFAVYLYHIIGISVASKFLAVLGISGNSLLLIASKCVAGIGLSLFAESIFHKFKITKFLFLGLKSRQLHAHNQRPFAKGDKITGSHPSKTIGLISATNTKPIQRVLT